jgi:hypothetical protein
MLNENSELRKNLEKLEKRTENNSKERLSNKVVVRHRSEPSAGAVV